MANRSGILKIILFVIFTTLLGWIGFELYHGNYLQAVAISGVGSVLIWFALGGGNRSEP